MLHRDIALRNMLLANGYIVKVADFGLARKVEEGSYQPSLSKPIALPVGYLAPETLQSGESTKKSECWAFGVALWELFTLAERKPYVQECGSEDGFAICAFLAANNRLLIPEITPLPM